jgi:hypothetical protein
MTNDTKSNPDKNASVTAHDQVVAEFWKKKLAADPVVISKADSAKVV